MARIVGHLPVEELEARYRPARERPHRQPPDPGAAGRPRQAALAKRVRRPPDDGGLWIGRKVAAWMARRLGLAKVHPQRGWEALKRIEWSIQAPRPRNPRAATPERRAAFKRGFARRSPAPGRPIPTGRSRSGPRTSTASA